MAPKGRVGISSKAGVPARAQPKKVKKTIAKEKNAESTKDANLSNSVQDTLDTTFQSKSSFERDRLILDGLSLRQAVTQAKLEARRRGGRVSKTLYEEYQRKYTCHGRIQERASGSGGNSDGPPPDESGNLDKEFRRVLGLSIIQSNTKRMREPLYNVLAERAETARPGHAPLSELEVRKLIGCFEKTESCDGKAGPQHIIQVP